MKKGFVSLLLFDGRVDNYDDWRFKDTTFLEMEDNFRELLKWTGKLTKIPELEDLDAWEFEQKNRNASLMSDQLCNFLCLHLKDEALTEEHEDEDRSLWRGLLVEVLLCLPGTHWATDPGIGERHLQASQGQEVCRCDCGD